MKKISILLFSILLVGLIACEDQLNQVPPTNLTIDSYYKTTSDVTQAVNAVYRALNGWDSRFTDLSENRSDNIYVSGTGPREQVRVNAFKNDLATSDMTSAPWTSNYLGISRANLLLEKMDSVNVPDAVLRARFEGEVKFLRAFNYFDLIRLYGKVPVVTKTLSIPESVELVRAPVADVYSLVISDLETAIVKLPSTYAAADKGRATKWAAEALLALVYLTRSGPTYGINGPGLASNEYAKALTLLDDIIGNGKNYSGGAFSLVTAGATPYASVFSYTNEYNAEIVWDLQAVDDGSTSLTNGLGTILPTTWYDVNYAGSLGITFAGGAEADAFKEVSKDLIAAYSSANDKRDDFTIIKSYTYKSVLYNLPQYVKFVDASKKPAARTNWPINFPVIRFADILLWKAEALIQSGGSSVLADQLINSVRQRAGLTVGEDVVSATIDELLAESRREFANEGRRWHDLVRSGKVIDVMNAFKATEDATRLKVMNDMISDFIIYPIPFSEITVNPNLIQNPGYL